MTAGRVVKNIPPKLVNFSAPLTDHRAQSTKSSADAGRPSLAALESRTDDRPAAELPEGLNG